MAIQSDGQVQAIDGVNQVEQRSGTARLVALEMTDQVPGDCVSIGMERGDLRLGLLYAVLPEVAQSGGERTRHQLGRVGLGHADQPYLFR